MYANQQQPQAAATLLFAKVGPVEQIAKEANDELAPTPVEAPAPVAKLLIQPGAVPQQMASQEPQKAVRKKVFFSRRSI
jgi:hypothetical protein